MKKKFFKGFTLIELIVVMAVLSILLAAIIRLFAPIRATYVDATLYETQRTAQNGVVKYLTESVRYSTDLGLYTQDRAGTITGAVEKFTDAYLAANGVTTSDPQYSAKRANTLKEMKKYAEVIIIDNNTYSFNGTDFTGRLLRRKQLLDTAGNIIPMTNDAENPVKDECRIALGMAYYGESDYTITMTPPEKDEDNNPITTITDWKTDWKATHGIKVSVASNAKYGSRSNKVISNTGLVICKNQSDSTIKGMFDTSNYTQTAISGPKTKVYVVFINEKIDIVP